MVEACWSIQRGPVICVGGNDRLCDPVVELNSTPSASALEAGSSRGLEVLTATFDYMMRLGRSHYHHPCAGLETNGGLVVVD